MRMFSLATLAIGTVLGACSAQACEVAQAESDGRLQPSEQSLAPGAPTATPGPILLDCITSWLAEEFDLPMIRKNPTIETASAADLARMRAGEAASSKADDVLALYEDGTRTIHLREGWSNLAPASASVLIHEMVHHLQNLADMKYECAEAREKLAYEAQDRWLARSGKSLESEFEIDPMTRLVRTNCM